MDDEFRRVVNKRTRVELRDGIPHEVVRMDEARRQWEAVMVSIWIGADLVDTAVASGLYLRALCLVRQELEGLAQLHHILNGSRKPTHSPNLSVLDRAIKQWYGTLSDGAHLASHDLVGYCAPADPLTFQQSIAVLPHGTSMFPIYNRHIARAILRLHFRVRIRLYREMKSYAAEIQQ